MYCKMEKLKRPPLRLNDRIRRLTPIPHTAKKVLRYALCAAVGFLLSNARMTGNIRPFLVAPAAALPSDCEIWAAFGSASGALLFCDTLGALKYIAAVVLITVLRIAAHSFFEKDGSTLPHILSAAGSLLICAVAVEAAEELTAAGVILSLCESILAGAGAFLLRTLICTAENGLGKIADRKTNVLLLIACGLGLLSFMNVRPFGFPVAGVFAGLTVLLWAYCDGECGGCLAGVCCGCIAGLSDDGAYTVISCCLGGLLSGICMSAGRFAAVMAYFVASLLTMVANGVTGNPVLYAIASLAAGIVFLLLPRNLLNKAKPFISISDAANTADNLRLLFEHRMQKTETAVNSFAKTAQQVNERIAKMKAPREEEICHYVRSVCCADCPRQSLCWDHSLAGLRPVFLQARQQIIKDGLLTPATLPDRLTAVCRKTDALLNAFNDAYARFLQRSAQNKEILAVKKLASTQLRTAAGVLEDMRTNNTAGEAVPALAKTVSHFLSKAEYPFSDIYAEYDAEKRIFIHISFNARPTRNALKSIGDLLSKKLRVQFAPAVRSDEKGLLYCFYEKPPYSVHCENIQHIGGREQVCGDTISCFRDTKGRFIALLSDGMGTGERAALDSMMTTGLTQTLLKANLSAQCTAKLVNAALLLRSRQETVATLDMAIVDLYTGKVQIYKAGASFSVLQNKSGVAIIEQQSLPLGILDDTDLAVCEFNMHDGDCLFLLSDGASSLSAEYFKTLQNTHRESLSDTVESILQEALQSNPQSKADDITCLAVRLVKTEKRELQQPAAAAQPIRLPILSES